ncbi:MAG: M4 family metallopeptidase [Flavobacteriaceae bacterium]|nr:M4 family metallopeptidase [Flavobacteriaceae bacterium]
MKKSTLMLFMSFLFIGAIMAQENGKNNKILKKTISKEGNPKAIIFSEDSFLRIESSKELFNKYFKMSQDDDLQIKSTEVDDIGFTHQKYQQFYKGVKVAFGNYTLHAKNGMVSSMMGDFHQINNVNTQPSLSADNALSKVIDHIDAEEYVWQHDNSFEYKKPEGELVVFPVLDKVNSESRLAYKFDIYAEKPLYRANVYIDAHTGEIIFENNRIHHADTPATGGSLYNGTVSFTAGTSGGSYVLNQTADGNGIQTYDMNSGTNYNNAAAVTSSSTHFSGSQTAVQAHWGAEQTHKYFSQLHSRNSYDNNGSVIKSYVSYNSNYVNAFWNGSVMTYGDGDGTNYGPLVSLDIVGHEISHGVTEYSANLTYSYESGALNESFSDIFGESIEFFAQGSNDWLMGDHIGAGGSGGALRSMSNPNAKNQPDTYNGTHWYSGSGDNGGVHYNSGVQNFWFYLLSEGGSGTNDNGDAYSVGVLGMVKASKIAYRNLTVYLNSSSQYADARTGAIQSAVDLYGAGSVEEIAVTNAWHAVGVGAAYGGSGNTGLYCTSKGSSVNDEYIGRVQLNTIDNTSNGGGGYSDHTSISTDLATGQAYTITVTPTWTGTVYAEGYSVWIDYNQDNDFDDAGEQVWSQSAVNTTPVSGSFTIPSSATVGMTRMRVSMKYNTIPTSCETYSYGEVEDYTVNIGTSSADTEAPTAPSSLVASNIAQTTLSLNWTASSDNVGVTGYDVYQGSANIGTLTGTSDNITGLTANTTYTYHIKAKDAAGNVSSSSNVITVTTLSDGSGGSGCTSGITSFPYTEGYENTLGTWTQSSGDDIDWTVDASGTPSSNTGPSGASEGTYYVYVEASGNGTGYPNKQAILNSPCYDLTNETEATFSFKYHMYGAADMGTIALEASTDDGTTWTSLWNKSGNIGNAWNDATVSLNSYVGNTVQLRFNRVTGSTWQADIAIDDVNLITSGGSNGNTVAILSLTFDNYPEETSWIIKDDSGATVASGGTYASQADGSTLNVNVDLPNGCYSFTINDIYGDGMCCSYGNGSYTLTDTSNSSTLASGGSFTSSETTSFCVGITAFSKSSRLVIQHNIDYLSIYPNPTSSVLNVSLLGLEAQTFQVKNVLGQTVLKGNNMKTIDVSKLNGGVYILQLHIGEKIKVKRFIKN